MRVFISWSGELSRELAEVFRKWLPSALQYVKPYFSPADIEKGSKWATEIFKELSASVVCIIILTRDNLNSNWIMFEAGAISCTIDRARVCPVIFEVEETDLQGPIAQFQATKFIKQDIRRLFNTINTAAGEHKLIDSVVDAVFEKWWPDLESELKHILSGHHASLSKPDIRSERDLIEELLLLTRKLSANQESNRVVETKNRVFGVAAPVKYEASLHKRMLDLASEIYAFGAGGFTSDELEEIKQSLIALVADVEHRPLAATIRAGLVKDANKILDSIAKAENDDIPF